MRRLSWLENIEVAAELLLWQQGGFPRNPADRLPTRMAPPPVDDGANRQFKAPAEPRLLHGSGRVAHTKPPRRRKSLWYRHLAKGHRSAAAIQGGCSRRGFSVALRSSSPCGPLGAHQWRATEPAEVEQIPSACNRLHRNAFNRSNTLGMETDLRDARKLSRVDPKPPQTWKK